MRAIFSTFLFAPFSMLASASNGDLDLNFGPTQQGFATYAFNLGGNNADYVRSVLLQSSGNIVLVGWSVSGMTSSVISLVRLLPTGALDSSFGNGGSTTFALASGGYSSTFPYLNAATLDSQGRILVTGDTATDECSYVARFTIDGILDSNFATGGAYAICPTTGHYIRFNDIAADRSGRTIVAGTYANLNGDFVTSSDFLAFRLTAAGQPDPSFNGGAIYTQSIGLVANSKDRAGAVALDSTGRIYLGGAAQASTYDSEEVLRLTDTGAPDTTCSVTGAIGLGSTASSGYNASSALFRDAHHLVLIGTYFAEANSAQSGIAFSDMDTDTCTPINSGISIPASGSASAGQAVAASDGAVYVSYSQPPSAGSPSLTGILPLYDTLPYNGALFGIYSGQNAFGEGIALIGGQPLQAIEQQFSGGDYDFALARFQNDRIFYGNFERDGAKASP